MKYDYETIQDKTVKAGVHYRVRDIDTDSRIATCYLECNAKLVVEALNELDATYRTFVGEDLREEIKAGKVECP